jgi:hypothetical protein
MSNYVVIQILARVLNTTFVHLVDPIPNNILYINKPFNGCGIASLLLYVGSYLALNNRKRMHSFVIYTLFEMQR